MLSKYAIALISPLGTALVLGLLAWLSGLRRRRRWATALGGLALAWLWLWSTPVASEALRAHLESRYPPVPVQQLPATDAAVVLGGVIAVPAPGFPLPDLNGAADRVWHAARLYHAGKVPLLVLSGGNAGGADKPPEAEAMQQFLLDLGVPRTAMRLETTSRTTAENAERTRALLAPLGIRRVLLVTSALHMSRARAHFERAGLEVVPVAVDHGARGLGDAPVWQRWLPDAGALDRSAAALKETIGRLAMP